jgi:hypothetical protein
MTAYVLILLIYTSSHELMSAAMQEFSSQQMVRLPVAGSNSRREITPSIFLPFS